MASCVESLSWILWICSCLVLSRGLQLWLRRVYSVLLPVSVEISPEQNNNASSKPEYQSFVYLHAKIFLCSGKLFVSSKQIGDCSPNIELNLWNNPEVAILYCSTQCKICTCAKFRWGKRFWNWGIENPRCTRMRCTPYNLLAYMLCFWQEKELKQKS